MNGNSIQRIIIDPAANGVILKAGENTKVFILEPGTRSRAVHDLLKEVANAMGDGLEVNVQVSDPGGREAAISSRSPRTKLKENDVSDEYSVPVKTLQGWRRLGTGPAYEKIGSSIYYDRTVLDEFFRKHRIMTTGEA
jgi:hypothetical protein